MIQLIASGESSAERTLRLIKSKLTDEACVALGEANIKALDLEQVTFTPKGFEHIAQSPFLRVVNVLGSHKLTAKLEKKVRGGIDVYVNGTPLSQLKEQRETLPFGFRRGVFIGN